MRVFLVVLLGALCFGAPGSDDTVRHTGWIYDLAYADAETLVSVGSDKTVRVWDLESGSHEVLRGHNDWVRAVALAPDGILVTGGGDYSVRLWKDGQEIGRPLRHTGFVHSLAVAPDGEAIFAGGSNGVLMRWSRNRDATTFGTPAHKGAINALLWAPEFLASAGDDSLIRIWSHDGKLLDTLVGHDGSVNDLVLYSDGRTLFSAGEDGRVLAWQKRSHPPAEVIRRPSAIRSLGTLRNGILVLEAEGRVSVHRKKGSSFVGMDSEALALAVTPDGRACAVAGEGGVIRRFTLDGSLEGELRGHVGRVYAVDVSAEGVVATGGADGVVRLWDSSGKPLRAPLAGHAGRVRALAFSPDGTLIVSGASDGDVRIWNLATERSGVMSLDHGRVRSVAWSPTADHLAAGFGDGTVLLVNVAGENSTVELGRHQGTVYSLAFAPDGERLLSGGGDSTLKLWSLEGKLLASWEANEARVYSVAFSPDGERIASGGGDGTLRLWSARGESVRSIDAHEGRVYGVAYAPDGHRIATCGQDGRVRLWSLEGDALEERLEPHVDWARALTFSPDGRPVSVGGDGALLFH